MQDGNMQSWEWRPQVWNRIGVSQQFIRVQDLPSLGITWPGHGSGIRHLGPRVICQETQHCRGPSPQHPAPSNFTQTGHLEEEGGLQSRASTPGERATTLKALPATGVRSWEEGEDGRACRAERTELEQAGRVDAPGKALWSQRYIVPRCLV